MAKDMIEDFVTDFDKYVEVINNPPTDVVEQLKKSTGQNTFPFIFFDGEFIGGFDQLKKPKTIVRIISVLETKYNITDSGDI